MTQAVAFKNSDELLKFIRDNEIQFVDFNFTDMRGQWQHTTQHVSTIDADLLKEGVYFDGSSINGWKDINESDMNLRPDLGKVCVDLFAAQPTIKLFCDVYEPTNGKPYDRDPRSIAKAAEKYLHSSGVGDTVFFGPEAEFFVFEDVKINMDMNRVGYEVDSAEGPYNSGTFYESGNLAHRPGIKGGYIPEAPVDSYADLRAEMVSVLNEMGVPVEKHHHEVAPSQNELGIKFSTLVDCADNMQLYKHVVKNTAQAYGKTATFIPKPVYGDNGSGMHCHQSIWKSNKPLFAGNEYAGLSEECLYYIGGIIKHAKALNAFTNPTTNSYKRLVPGYEAPVLLAYSTRNRSAACRVPHTASEKARRIEVRFPDATANSYLAFAAMLMAGLDGIENKIHPGEAMEDNLYELSEDQLANVPTVAGSLREAVECLRDDYEFLLKGGVFTQDAIAGFIELKMEEIEIFETMPHPVEMSMYYSA